MYIENLDLNILTQFIGLKLKNSPMINRTELVEKEIINASWFSPHQTERMTAIANTGRTREYETIAFYSVEYSEPKNGRIDATVHTQSAQFNKGKLTFLNPASIYKFSFGDYFYISDITELNSFDLEYLKLMNLKFKDKNYSNNLQKAIDSYRINSIKEYATNLTNYCNNILLNVNEDELI